MGWANHKLIEQASFAELESALRDLLEKERSLRSQECEILNRKTEVAKEKEIIKVELKKRLERLMIQ